MNVKGKVIVVTGGAHGIGRALCNRFHLEGALSVTVADIDRDGAQLVAASIDGYAMYCDVSRELDVAQVVAETERLRGPVDLFCSSAGVLDRDTLLDEVTSTPNEAWMRAWSVNVMAHVYAARACLPGMVARGSGHFLQTVSAAGLLTQIHGTVYSVTKHAAVGFAECLAIGNRDKGIKVSMLCPQGVDTATERRRGNCSDNNS